MKVIATVTKFITDEKALRDEKVQMLYLVRVDSMFLFIMEVHIISWQSKKLNRVTKSPLASEALALSEAADAGVLIASIWQEVFGLSVLPRVLCHTDNESLKEALYSSKVVSDRRLPSRHCLSSRDGRSR